MPPKKRAPAKRPAKNPPPPPPPKPKKRSRAFKKAGLAASGLVTLGVVLPCLRKLLKDEETFVVANPSGPGSGVDTYPRTATVLADDELDDLSAAFGDLGVADAVDEPPTPAFRAAMNVPQLGLPEIDAADAAALEALHKAGAAMMVPKKKKGWTWTKGRGLGLTGETVGSSHVAALYGGGLLQSHRHQTLAAGLAERLAKTRKLGAAAKLRIVEAGKRHLKHVSPRKMVKNMTRPQAMAAIGSLLAGVALAAGGRDRLAAAAKAGLKLAAFRDVLGSRAAPIDDNFVEVEGPEVEDGVEMHPRRATHFTEDGLGAMANVGPGPENFYPRRASVVKPGGLGSVAPKRKAPKRKARPKTLAAMTMAEKNALGFASSHGAGLTGMKRLPGACRSGKCDHAAHLRFSNALG